MTVTEAAARLEVSRSFVYRLLRAGQLACEKRGRRRVIDVRSLKAYEDRNHVPARKEDAVVKEEPSWMRFFK